jgi:hypothetical protein
VAEGAGIVPVGAWIDDFKRMQRRVAKKYKQRRKAQTCEQICSRALECMWPGNSQTTLKPPTRSHQLSRSRILR